MLVFGRKVNQEFSIQLPDKSFVMVKVLHIKKGLVRLGIEAPPGVPVHRKETWDKIELNEEKAGEQ